MIRFLLLCVTLIVSTQANATSCDSLIEFLSKITTPINIPLNQIKFGKSKHPSAVSNQQHLVYQYKSNLRHFREKVINMIYHKPPSLVVYPAGGFDLATSDLLFPEVPTTVIINRTGAFLLPRHLIRNEKIKYETEVIQQCLTWGPTLTNFGTVKDMANAHGMLSLILARQKRFFDTRFNPISVTAFPMAESTEMQGRCHGCLTYTLGREKIPKTLIYIHGGLEDALREGNTYRPSIQLTDDASPLVELPHDLLSNLDVLLGKGAMGHFIIEENLHTLFEMLKHNKGLVVEGYSGHSNGWEFSTQLFDTPQKSVNQVTDMAIPFSYEKGLRATRVQNKQ